MKSLLQIAICLALFASAAILISQGGFVWEGMPPLEAWNVFGTYSSMEDQRQLGEQLIAQNNATLARMARNSQISRQVLEGHETLRQAAAEFEATNRDFGGMWDTYSMEHEGWSRRKLSAVGVIKGVEEILVQQGHDSTEAVALLMAEVEQWDDSGAGR